MEIVTKLAMKMWDGTAKADAKRIAAQRPTPGITQVTDIAYLPDSCRGHLLDIYYPEGTQEPLPVVIDIHGGGADLVFPHHENELAQSHAAGYGFARYIV